MAVGSLTRERVRFLVFMLVGCSLFNGCVYIPIPGTAEVLFGREVREDQRLRLEIGKTTRVEVLSLLGEPTLAWEDERIIGYDWVKSPYSALFVTTGGGGIVVSSKQYVLLIQFDDNDRVARHELVDVRAMGRGVGETLRDWAKQPARTREQINK